MSRIAIFAAYISICGVAAVLAAQESGNEFYTNSIYDADRRFSERKSSYIVLAPKVVRPGHVYRVVITMFQLRSPTVLLRGSVSSNGVQIASDNDVITMAGQSANLMMKIPSNLRAGEYKLRLNAGVKNSPTSIFTEESNLEFSVRSLTISIQTNKASYQHKDTIRARVIMLSTEQKPFQDPVNIHVLQPRGYVVKRWVSYQSSLGVVSISLKLPLHPTSGWWTIRVIAQSQIAEQKVWVKRFMNPNIIVNVDAPAFVLDSAQYITGSVLVNKTKSWAPIYGSLIMHAKISRIDRYSRNQVVKQTEKQAIEQFNGIHHFKFAMSDLRQLVNPLLGTEIEIQARVMEYFTNITFTGYVRVRVINETINLRYLGTSPQIFKPGMPFETYIAVSYSDQVSLELERLQDSSLTIVPEVTFEGRGQGIDTIVTQFPENGVYKIKIIPPKRATQIKLFATYKDDRVTKTAELLTLAAYSPTKRYVHVTTSTTDAAVGQFIIFHVRSNFYFEQFHYIVMAKGIIQLAETESVTGNYQITHTFAVPVSSAMSPSTTLVIYVLSDDKILSDTVTVPVKGIVSNQLFFELRSLKDKTGKSVEMNIVNYPGAMTFISAMDASAYDSQSKNEVNRYTILKEMYKFENNRNKLQGIVWKSRADIQTSHDYFVTANYGYDNYQTFESVGLIVYSDANITRRADPCESYSRYNEDGISTTAVPAWMSGYQDNRQTRYLSCVTDYKCYPVTSRCNGIIDCFDKSDEANCEGNDDADVDTALFFMLRKNWQPHKFDVTGKDFAWQDISVGPNEDTQVSIGTPNRPTNWIFNAYSMHSEYGLGFIDEPLVMDGRIPFYLKLEAPPSAIIYEQVAIKISAYNLLNYEIEVLLEVQKSDKFKFVFVEGLGQVSHYSPRTTQNNIQHLIFIKAHSNKIVNIPVVAIDEGKITVKVKGRTQVGMDEASTTIKIKAEGAMQFYHTSLLLNLRNVPVQLSYLNMNITETPIIPYQLYRRYVWGSPVGQVSVSGDVVGPAFPKFPVKPSDLRLTNIRTGELKAFDFGYHLLTLKYLWLTNQRDAATVKKVFNHLQVSLSDLLGHFKNNYFYQFKANTPSVWLTSHVARMLQLSRFSEWENSLFIDPKIISDSVSYLVTMQKEDGSFYDNEKYPFDRKMAPTKMLRAIKNRYTQETKYVDVYENVSLTAHVLLTLIQVTDLREDVRIKALNCRSSALKFLGQRLDSITDPYILSLVAYTLTLANSNLGTTAFRKLDAMKRTQADLVYWSKEELPNDEIFIQNQRPYIVPRKKQKYDAANVETAAYALMTYIRHNGFLTDNIVKWLIKVKYSDAGFCSTRDTLVAMEALTDYSYRTRDREVTDIKVKIEASSLAEENKIFYINKESLSKQQKLIMPDVHGNIEAIASGAGLGLLQLGVTFGVDRKRVMIPPPVKAFDLNVVTSFSGRNNSNLHIQACTRWTLLDESERSGYSMLEIQLPSGYYLWGGHFKKVMNSFPEITGGIIRDRVLRVSMASVGSEQKCLNFSVVRWYPIANMTRFMLARVYEYFAPENYAEEVIDVYAVHVLSICQVCGSYQCPYCPDFSHAVATAGSTIVLIAITFIFSFFVT